MTEQVAGKLNLVYYDEKVTNKGANPEVYFDCFGNPIYVLPGKTQSVRRVRREQTVPVPAPEVQAKKDSTDGEKPKQPKGKNS